MKNNKFDNYKILMQSKNIYYVEINKGLIYDYLEMVNDESVQRGISTKRKVYSYEDEMNWITKKIDENKIIFSMIEKKSENFIGNFEFMNIEGDTAEIGICITPKYQNMHYGTETIKTMIEYGFNNLGLKEINLSVFSNNIRAINCYKKIGFIEYEVDKNAYVVGNETIDDIYMRIKREK